MLFYLGGSHCLLPTDGPRDMPKKLQQVHCSCWSVTLTLDMESAKAAK